MRSEPARRGSTPEDQERPGQGRRLNQGHLQGKFQGQGFREVGGFGASAFHFQEFYSFEALKTKLSEKPLQELEDLWLWAETCLPIGP